MFLKGGDKNFGESKRLYVANNSNGKWQSLLLFNLSLVPNLFGPVVSAAMLGLYSAWGSDSVWATFRKMARGGWMERGIV